MIRPAPKLSALSKPKSVSILGVTGTIGQNTIELIEQNPSVYKVKSITAGKNVNQLIETAKRIAPEIAVIQDETLYPQLKAGLAKHNIETACGSKAVINAASEACDILVSGIVGVAALEPTMAAIKKGNNVALANKECLVCAGSLLTSEAKNNNAQIIPVDSEHNSIFQSFDFANPARVEKITLTASGGPFHKFTKEQMEKITPQQAVKHPNWNMGAKISVDSATMMNKGLEIIEAYHLFPIEKSQIEVIVHPESVIHSLVSFVDGAVVAGLSVPDMKVPIAYALGWPERINSSVKKLDLTELGKLTFEKVDEYKFPAIVLAKQALSAEGSAPTVLNAANEIAVQSFLDGKIGFLDIVKLVRNAVEEMPHSRADSIEEVLAIDSRTRDWCNRILQEDL